MQENKNIAKIPDFIQRKIESKTKTKTRAKNYLVLVGLVVLVGLGFYGIYKINQFFENNKLVFQNPVRIGFYAPVYITKREKPESKTIIQEIKANSPLNEIQQYICDKFGPDCKMALAVSRAENGTMQCDRFGINTNGTIDLGVFQINSVHMKKGWKLVDLVDCQKNVDFAYEIFKAQGWSPWVAYNNGNYKKFLY